MSILIEKCHLRKHGGGEMALPPGGRPSCMHYVSFANSFGFCVRVEF